jgi:hypothetical protein
LFFENTAAVNPAARAAAAVLRGRARRCAAMEELELVKENVLPLRRGRALPPPGAAAATEGPDPGRATKLEEERRCAHRAVRATRAYGAAACSEPQH